MNFNDDFFNKSTKKVVTNMRKYSTPLFRPAGRVYAVEIASKILGKSIIVFKSYENIRKYYKLTRSAFSKKTVYHESEVAEMIGVDKEMVVGINIAKEIFEGSFLVKIRRK